MNRRLNVEIVTATGRVVMERSGGAGRVLDLRFTTGLPGGFREASLTARLPAARLWGVEAGQTLVIRRGDRIVWWGWVEDVRWRGQGSLREVGITALGAYQETTQRLIMQADYDQYTQSSAALRQELLLNCPHISRNYSGIESTGVAIGPLTRDFWAVSDLARAAGDAGNAAGQRMLFAVWEPSERISAAEGLHSRNVLINPDFEGPDWQGWVVNDYKNGDSEVITSNYVSALRSRKAFCTSAVAGGYLTLRSAQVLVAANTQFQFDYQFYFPAVSGALSATVSVLWLPGSTWSYGPTWTLMSLGSGWHARSSLMTSPADAETCIAYLRTDWDAGTEKYALWDECYLSETTTAQVRDGLPRAYFWPRDLTDWDYELITRRVTGGVDVTAATRELTNAVTASYASDSFTAIGEDAMSQARYRRRDRVVTAGQSAGAGFAEAMRDAALLRYAQPQQEAGAFRVQQAAGAVVTRRGSPVHLEDVRAGARLRLADGPQAGLVLLVEATEWRSGELLITPEARPGVPLLLARR